MREGDRTRSGPAHDERRSQIMRAALREFATRGIGGTKMSMIAEGAGVSQGLPYRYFSSKEELFTSLVREALEEASETIANLHELPGSPREQLRALTRTMLADDHRLHFLLIQKAQLEEAVPAEAKQLLERHSTEKMFEHLIPIFLRGQQLGEFREGDPYRLLFLYFSVVTGLMLQDAPAHPDYWLGEVDLLMRILER